MFSSDRQKLDQVNQQFANFYQQGRYEEAVSMAEQSVNLTRSLAGEQHPDYSASLNDLAEMHRLMGNYAAAEPLYLQALDIDRQVLGEKHPDFATSLENLADLYSAMGNHAAAERLLFQALEIIENL